MFSLIRLKQMNEPLIPANLSVYLIFILLVKFLEIEETVCIKNLKDFPTEKTLFAIK